MPDTLRLGFVTGTTPDKWARAWREQGRRLRIFSSGSVHAQNDPHGGARLTMQLPPLAMTEAEIESAAAAEAELESAAALQQVPPIL